MTEDWGAILVVDDDADMRRLLCDVLQGRGHQCTGVGSGQGALKHSGEEEYAVVFTDFRMKGMPGTELLAEIKQLVSGHRGHSHDGFWIGGDRGRCDEAGASDYLTKPVKTEELVRVVERSIREAALRREVNRLRREVHKEYSFHQIIGKSKPMQEIFDLIRRVADSPTNLLITGESGTGKELVAKAIHYNSDRRDAPFIPVNCAAIPEQLLESELFGHMRGAFTDAKADKRGLFEEAQKGTLFLDEISELPLMLQAKMLRAIQEKEIRRVGANKPISVDVRIIAATNLNLTEEVKAKRFREDLYYRLNVIELRLPPLRERREDIPLLVRCVHEEVCGVSRKQIQGVSEAALAMLVDYAWPGNVRELENVIERAVTLSRSDRSLRTISRPRFRGPVAIGACSMMRLNGPCRWTKWRKNTSSRFSRRRAATSTRPHMSWASIERPSIGNWPKSKARHTRTSSAVVSPSRWEVLDCSFRSTNLSSLNTVSPSS